MRLPSGIQLCFAPVRIGTIEWQISSQSAAKPQRICGRYVPPANKNLAKYLDERVADAKRLHAAPYASEWNFGASSPLDVTTFFSNVASFESRRISYTGWQYKK